MKVHSNDRKFVCNICAKTFIQRSAYTTHMKGHQSVLKEYQCELCGRSFNQKSSLTVHLRIHSDEKRFECNQCEKRFAQRHQLTYHVKALHSQIKAKVGHDKIEGKAEINNIPDKQRKNLPYICTICDKRFKVKFYSEEIEVGSRFARKRQLVFRARSKAS